MVLTSLILNIGFDQFNVKLNEIDIWCDFCCQNARFVSEKVPIIPKERPCDGRSFCKKRQLEKCDFLKKCPGRSIGNAR